MYINVPEARIARFKQGLTSAKGLYTEKFTCCVIIIIHNDGFQKISLIHASKFSDRSVIQQECKWVGRNKKIRVYLRANMSVFDPSSNKSVPNYKLLFPETEAYVRGKDSFRYKDITNAWDELTEIEPTTEAICVDVDRGILQLNKEKSCRELLFHPGETQIESNYDLWQIFGFGLWDKFMSNLQALIFNGETWVKMHDEPREFFIIKERCDGFFQYLFSRDDFDIRCVRLKKMITPQTISYMSCAVGFQCYVQHKKILFPQFKFGTPGFSDICLLFGISLHKFFRKFNGDQIFTADFENAKQDLKVLHCIPPSYKSRYLSEIDMIINPQTAKQFCSKYADQYSSCGSLRGQKRTPDNFHIRMYRELKELLNMYERNTRVDNQYREGISRFSPNSGVRNSVSFREALRSQLPNAADKMRAIQEEIRVMQRGGIGVPGWPSSMPKVCSNRQCSLYGYISGSNTAWCLSCGELYS